MAWKHIQQEYPGKPLKVGFGGKLKLAQHPADTIYIG